MEERRDSREENAQLFDALCGLGITHDGVKDIVRRAFEREARETPCDVPPNILRILKRLCSVACVALGDPRIIDDKEVCECTRQWIRVIIRSWLETMRDALSREPSVVLDDDLLVPEAFIDEQWRGIFPAETVASLAINDEDTLEILRLIAENIPHAPEAMKLPRGTRIQRMHDASRRTLCGVS